MAGILRTLLSGSHACPCCSGQEHHPEALQRVLSVELAAVRDISSFVLLNLKGESDGEDQGSEFSYCTSDFGAPADASAATAAAPAESLGELDDGEQDRDDESFPEAEEGESDVEERCFRETYDDVSQRAEHFESGMGNHKRGGKVSRSKGATKASHKLETKQRRQIRSGQVAVKGNTRVPPTRTVYHHGRKFSSGFKTIEELREALRMARGGQQGAWGSSSSAPAQHHHHDYDHHRAEQAAPAALQPFVLREAGAASGLEALLAQLQHRDLTAEDYELLLRLDESVKPKTVATTLLNSLPVHEVAAGAPAPFCPVCQCDVEPGERAKTLPCGHVFHVDCIDQWLSTAADRCPVDSVSISH